MRWDSLRGTVPSYFLLFKGFVTIHGLVGRCPLTPEVYGDGNSYAYAGRQESCPISHTDWGNAPMNFRLTATNTLRRAFAYKSP